MPNMTEDFLKSLSKAGKRNSDSGMTRHSKPEPNEELNKVLGAPKGTVVKPVPMPMQEKPDSDDAIDINGKKVRLSDIKAVKKGGAINLSKCKVNTTQKNSSSSNW
jgi:hypothetical protein